MNKTICYREAHSGDIAEIREIRLMVKENTLSDPSIITYEMCQEYLDLRGRGWVCELDGKIRGFSYAAREDGSIWALFIRPEYEGQGIGSRLLKLATAWLFELGHTQVILGTSPDTRADRFYQAQGWQRGAMKNAKEVCYSLQNNFVANADSQRD
jgi:GNAT superfamily N-acetyltransferase